MVYTNVYPLSLGACHISQPTNFRPGGFFIFGNVYFFALFLCKAFEYFNHIKIHKMFHVSQNFGHSDSTRPPFVIEDSIDLRTGHRL
jgi:hypothetical protein